VTDPWAIPVDWPPPSPEALAHGRRVQAAVDAAIEAAGGALPFADYMECVLHAPGLGYYSAGARKFGVGGDFVTAPELTPLFGACLANAVAPVLETTGGDLLEIGPGSGRLMADLAGALDRLGRLPRRILLLERSAELRERQRETLAQALPESKYSRVAWLEHWPEGFVGAVVANEVLDAFAVERFRITPEGAERFHVVRRADGWDWALQPGAGRFAEAVRALRERHDLPPGFVGEWCPGLEAWIAGLAEALAQGAVILIDYGEGARARYRPERSGGTLKCHYRHRMHEDPLLLPGLQDITADVDFTAVAEAARRGGMAVAAFVTQAEFLMDAGIEAAFEAQAGSVPGPALWRTAQAVRTLMLPGEMGERVRVMLLTRGLDRPLPGFRGRGRLAEL